MQNQIKSTCKPAAHHTWYKIQRPYHSLHGPKGSVSSSLSDLTPTIFPLVHFTLVTLTFLLLLEYTKPAPTSGHLHMPFLLSKYHSSPSYSLTSPSFYLAQVISQQTSLATNLKWYFHPDWLLHAAQSSLPALIFFSSWFICLWPSSDYWPECKDSVPFIQCCIIPNALDWAKHKTCASWGFMRL